jgi:hypothetical protein
MSHMGWVILSMSSHRADDVRQGRLGQADFTGIASKSEGM